METWTKTQKKAITKQQLNDLLSFSFVAFYRGTVFCQMGASPYPLGPPVKNFDIWLVVC